MVALKRDTVRHVVLDDGGGRSRRAVLCAGQFRNFRSCGLEVAADPTDDPQDGLSGHPEFRLVRGRVELDDRQLAGPGKAHAGDLITEPADGAAPAPRRCGERINGRSFRIDEVAVTRVLPRIARL